MNSTPSHPFSLAIESLTIHLEGPLPRLLQATLHPLANPAPAPDPNFPARTFRDLQWDQLIGLIRDKARTSEGQHLLDNFQVPSGRDALEHRLLEIQELMKYLDTEAAPPIDGLRDIRQAVQRVLREGTLSVEDLDAISRNCDVAARIQRYFKGRKEPLPRLSQVGELVDPCQPLRDALSHAIEPGGHLSDNASPDLGRLRRAVQNQHDRISTKVDQVLKSSKLEHALRDDYFTLREDRYVLPIRVGAKNQVAGIVHGYSSSGQTAFIEPQELIELNNQLRWAQIELQEEIDRILQRLSRLAARFADELLRNIELLAYIDVVLAIARFGRSIDATIPTLTDDTLELKQARHPLLDLKIRAENKDSRATPNDIHLDKERRVLIISGPNTGGKTVTLKTTGLCALMARSGFPLPVEEGSSIPVFEALFTDIGDEQSIERDLSTFSAHVTNIQGFLHRCGPGTLVLLDELFVGTDPLQGAALATALLEDLANRDATTIVTTHLEGLKTLAYQADAFANASMGFDLETLSPTYHMTLGVPGSSFAVRIANRLGLDEHLITRAEKILEGQDHHSVEEVLQGLEEQVRQLESEKKRLQHARHQAEQRQQKYSKKYKKLLEKERSGLFDETQTLRRDLRKARDMIRQQLKTLLNQRTIEAGDLSQQDLQALQKELKGAEDTLEKTREKTRPPKATPGGLVSIEPDELEAGMLVYSGPFKRQGTLLEFDLNSNQARVQLGDLKVNSALADLYYPSEAGRRAHLRGHQERATPQQGSSSSSSASSDDAVLLPQTSDNSVDLRGAHVDEALERMDLFLDHAYLNNLRAVYIIHGHGTGALKRAVRGNLPQSRYVDRFRRGERGEGGDGVTIAFLKEKI